MSLSPKEMEDGENEMSEDKDNGSTDEVVIPRKNGRKVTTAPGNKVEGKRSLAPTFAEKLISHHRKGVTWAKLPKDKKSAKLEDREERNENYEEDEAEPPVTFRLLVGSLNFNKTDAELKTGLSEFFAKNDLVIVGVRVGLSRVAYIDFKSQAEAERALEEKQGTEIGRLAVVLDCIGKKSQGQEGQDRKHSPWRVGKRRIEQESHTFQEKWERAYFFVEVKSVPTCLICKQSLSVLKEYNLRRHYEIHHSRNHDGCTEKMRDKKLNKLKKRLKFQHDLLLNVNKISDAAMKCSYVLSEKIARASKPLTDGEFIKECLLSAADIMCPEQRPAFANIRLSGNVVGQHIDNMTENLQDKLQEKAKSFVAFSIAAHESADINNTPQLAVFIRGVDEAFDVTEELLDMVPMTSTTSGNELFLCVEKSLKKFNVDWSKLVSVSTDGSSAMVGVKQLVTKLKPQVSGLCKDTELKSVHGLILQESLCANKLKMDHVMDVVIYTITWIHSHGSNHRKFSALFNELDAQYGSLFCSMELKWLSRGMVLRQFFELLGEIDFFMSSKGKSVPQLNSKDWVKDLGFLVDIMTYLNTLDISLQGRSQVVTQMYDSIRSFLAKLCLWETHLARNNLAHFHTLKLVSENENDGLNYIPKIKELKTEFQKRFSDFKLYENKLILFSSPFSININNVNEELQMEVIELQYNTILKAKYDDVGIPEFYKYLGNGYPKYKNHCAKILSMFGSTYICEQFFSVMKLNKTKYCSQLKDSKMNSLLCVATQNSRPDID
ncbi:general transcription factor II-I repeat domain-containing protein 2-like isoform X2 [Diceros bicornis minor]|uniref:general transcription factor II-I repeat domain-containing protein 2-like isoform X2 n=1 Tax=Diceros bicornis minor TaxID=77932 RepID=UPI0026EDDC94|nr:general transcription factor II-I repeat domain-containing protein 2-like isoform X2 [Diceros bicornis minor]